MQSPFRGGVLLPCCVAPSLLPRQAALSHAAACLLANKPLLTDGLLTQLAHLAPCPPFPSPPAVRNLVEQAQFAHLCTIMCNMHHRRAGYPFGSLVDFAADGAGHPIFRC